jgi:HAD superfamily hydrolase (TIGR01509 family)
MLSAPAKVTLGPFRAVVFDMDGTLLDTESVFREIVFTVCGGLGFEMTNEVHLAMVGSSHEATNRLLVEAYGVSFPYALFDEQCREMFHAAMIRTVPVKEGVAELLGELRHRGIPAAVATSSRNAHAFGHLGRAGLLDLFETVVTRDDVENPKPHPEPYLTAASRLNMLPQHCLAVRIPIPECAPPTRPGCRRSWSPISSTPRRKSRAFVPPSCAACTRCAEPPSIDSR